MADQGDAHTLVVIAIFCIAMSVMSTCLVTAFVNGSSDYDYDTINAYRSELTSFSGGQLINDNPWVLSAVHTPFTPGSIPDDQIPNHIDDDNGQSIGWLYGENITTYPYLGEVANIKLDPNQKSNQLLTAGGNVDYRYENSKEWWAGNNDLGVDLSGIGRFFIELAGNDASDYGKIYTSGSANNWAFSGLMYIFDPVLPFDDQASSKDGRLYLVWYSIPNDSGLSGALEVYGADKAGNQVKYGSISSSDIVSAVQSSAGYVQVFDFNFEGTHLNLTIRFDPTVYNSHSTLQQAWDAGAWSMAISSASAGNFFDVEASNAFNATAGSMLETFVQIYTFEYPHFEDSWIEFIMWLLVGLPATMGMLLVTARLVGGVFKIWT